MSDRESRISALRELFEQSVGVAREYYGREQTLSDRGEKAQTAQAAALAARAAVDIHRALLEHEDGGPGPGKS